MATGVLVVGVERATRLLGHLTATSKEYLATIRLGISTVTDDAEGEVTARVGATGVSTGDVTGQLGAFVGDIFQTPSAVSAIKVNGVRSYARVRAGEDPALTPRPVTISRYDVLDLRHAERAGTVVLDLDVHVECSSGTYIRALARDLGVVLGVGGHLTALRRTRVGPFDLDRAQTLDSASADLRLIDLFEVAQLCFPVVQVDEAQARFAAHGRRLPGLALTAPTTALVTAEHEFLALYRPGSDEAVPISVFT
jgi:tRNA pseudouridine55 synthase